MSDRDTFRANGPEGTEWPRHTTATPGQCSGCHRDYDQHPGPGCPYPEHHDDPRSQENMSTEHNHPPRCCCPATDRCDCAGALIETYAHETHCSTQQPCLACPEHGQFAAPYTEQETTNG